MYGVRLALLGMLTAALVGCGSTVPQGDGRLQVTASFYPLEYLLERIGGPDVVVTTLTRPGAEPHDLELTPRDVATLGRSRLVAYESGFQPSVDAAVAALDPTSGGPTLVDVRTAAEVTDNPHFWLDPVRYAAVARLVGAQLGAVDPAHAAAYASRTDALVADLRVLDSAYRSGLESCASRDLVTSHAAFGLLAQRYGLREVAVAGVLPDVEPSAARIARVVADIRSSGVRTVYTETLVPALVAEVVARETGATVAVLDPLEGLTSESAGPDYLSVMRHNLEVLRTGQECS